MAERREHPVVWGLVALALVSGALGLILGLGALAVSRVAGVGSTSSGASAGAQESMFLPKPEKTQSASPSASGSGSGSAAPQSEPGKKPKKSKSATTAITLTAGQTAVSPMQRIDLTGSYRGGNGAIVQVQRFESGGWKDFPVTASVSGATFSTYIQTGRPGVNRFRVVDSDSGKASNEVKVTIG